MAVLRSIHIAHEASPKEALTWFQRSIFADIPASFMTHWKTGKKFFMAGDALLAFEETPQHLVVAGEPLVAAETTDRELYFAFLEFAKRKKKKLCGYYVGKEWNWRGFFKVPLGTSVTISLPDFDFQGPQAREVRRSLRYGARKNYECFSVDSTDQETLAQIQKLYEHWHQSKLPFHLSFFLSRPNNSNLVRDYEEWFVVKRGEECLAYCSLLPFLKEGELGFYVDHLVYDPKREPQALSYLVSHLIETLQEEGVSYLNLGLNPFARVDKTQWMGKLFKLLYHIPYFYRPKGLHYFKKKFSGFESPEYCFFQQKKNRWRGLADMARVTLMPPAPPQ